jgi:hypothetical protein
MKRGQMKLTFPLPVHALPTFVSVLGAPIEYVTHGGQEPPQSGAVSSPSWTPSAQVDDGRLPASGAAASPAGPASVLGATSAAAPPSFDDDDASGGADAASSGALESLTPPSVPSRGGSLGELEEQPSKVSP